MGWRKGEPPPPPLSLLPSTTALVTSPKDQACRTFTMKLEEYSGLPFPDVFVVWNKDGSLSHRVYRKPTHRDLYLSGLIHHHPAPKQTALSTLVHRARAMSNVQSLSEEFTHLKFKFRHNTYSSHDIMQALNKTGDTTKPPSLKEPKGLLFIPFHTAVSDSWKPVS